ncbi:MAG: LytTR family DNA-binding domain-containing protein [Bacteroidota bacterium]
MTKAVIIEDEKLAVNALLQTISEISDSVRIEAVLGSVTESITYLSAQPGIDIIFSDVQLPDGYSFEIFKAVNIKTPVIFTTAYDEFMMNAFTYNGIDYLLKPVDKKDLEKAFFKYRMFEKHFAGQPEKIHQFADHFDQKKKNRLVVKRGLEYISLKLDDIVLFYTENKLVYVIDITGKKFIAEKTLGDLEETLDNSQFFRANRQYIININFIKGFKPFERVKLQVDLTVPELHHQIIISQETCPQFRKWMYSA